MAGRQLADDVRTVVADMDQFLDALRSDSAGKAAALRARYDTTLAGAKLRLADARAAGTAATRRAIADADLFAHRHPWRTAGLAAAGGVAVGALFSVLATKH
jgi:ElaB/YqjD/DUF883 family membrane-anchored ribosome-binding protein